MLTRMYVHSTTILTIFKDYNSLLMLENSQFNVIITNKIPTFIEIMKLADNYLNVDLVILRKNGSSCIFTSSGILPVPKIFIKVIRGLPALEVLNFQSSSFLKALKCTECRNYLQTLPGIKFGAGTRA